MSVNSIGKRKNDGYAINPGALNQQKPLFNGMLVAELGPGTSSSSLKGRAQKTPETDETSMTSSSHHVPSNANIVFKVRDASPGCKIYQMDVTFCCLTQDEISKLSGTEQEKKKAIEKQTKRVTADIPTDGALTDAEYQSLYCDFFSGIIHQIRQFSPDAKKLLAESNNLDIATVSEGITITTRGNPPIFMNTEDAKTYSKATAVAESEIPNAIRKVIEDHPQYHTEKFTFSNTPYLPKKASPQESAKESKPESPAITTSKPTGIPSPNNNTCTASAALQLIMQNPTLRDQLEKDSSSELIKKAITDYKKNQPPNVEKIYEELKKVNPAIKENQWQDIDKVLRAILQTLPKTDTEKNTPILNISPTKPTLVQELEAHKQDQILVHVSRGGKKRDMTPLTVSENLAGYELQGFASSVNNGTHYVSYIKTSGEQKKVHYWLCDNETVTEKTADEFMKAAETASMLSFKKVENTPISTPKKIQSNQPSVKKVNKRPIAELPNFEQEKEAHVIIPSYQPDPKINTNIQIIESELDNIENCRSLLIPVTNRLEGTLFSKTILDRAGESTKKANEALIPKGRKFGIIGPQQAKLLASSDAKTVTAGDLQSSQKIDYLTEVVLDDDLLNLKDAIYNGLCSAANTRDEKGNYLIDSIVIPLVSESSSLTETVYDLTQRAIVQYVKESVYHPHRIENITINITPAGRKALQSKLEPVISPAYTYYQDPEVLKDRIEKDLRAYESYTSPLITEPDPNSDPNYVNNRSLLANVINNLNPRFGGKIRSESPKGTIQVSKKPYDDKKTQTKLVLEEASRGFFAYPFLGVNKPKFENGKISVFVPKKPQSDGIFSTEERNQWEKAMKDALTEASKTGQRNPYLVLMNDEIGKQELECVLKAAREMKGTININSFTVCLEEPTSSLSEQNSIPTPAQVWVAEETTNFLKEIKDQKIPYAKLIQKAGSAGEITDIKTSAYGWQCFNATIPTGEIDEESIRKAVVNSINQAQKSDSKKIAIQVPACTSFQEELDLLKVMETTATTHNFDNMEVNLLMQRNPLHLSVGTTKFDDKSYHKITCKPPKQNASDTDIVTHYHDTLREQIIQASEEGNKEKICISLPDDSHDNYLEYVQNVLKAIKQASQSYPFTDVKILLP